MLRKKRKSLVHETDSSDIVVAQVVRGRVYPGARAREASINYRSVTRQSFINCDGAYFRPQRFSRRAREAERAKGGRDNGGRKEGRSCRGELCPEARANVTRSEPAPSHDPFVPRALFSPAPPLEPLRYALEVVTVISGCRRDFRAFASSTSFSLASDFWSARKISREGVQFVNVISRSTRRARIRLPLVLNRRY